MRIVSIAILCIALLCVCGTRNGTHANEDDTRDFTLRSLDGQEYTLSSLKGNVVLVDFWTTWCPPCRNSIPVLMSLYEKYQGQGFIVLGVSNEDIATLKKFRDNMNMNYPILVDNQNIMQSYGVRSIPNMYIFNKKGKVAKHQIGFSPEMEVPLTTFIDSLLKE
jgi:peroxiredoxin